MPGLFIVIVPKKLNVSAQLVLEFGETPDVPFVTTNGGEHWALFTACVLETCVDNYPHKFLAACRRIEKTNLFSGYRGIVFVGAIQLPERKEKRHECAMGFGQPAFLSANTGHEMGFSTMR